MPSILSARHSNQWINRLHQKFTALAALPLAAEKKLRLKEWLTVEFVYSALAFEGAQVNRQLVLQIVQASPKVKEAHESSLIEDLLKRFRHLENIIENAGQKANLSNEWLCRLNVSQEFRQSDFAASSVRAEHLPLIVENACRWFAMESFAELNPIEQAAIALLRIAEIAPFERDNQQTALLAASLFTLRQGLPPGGRCP